MWYTSPGNQGWGSKQLSRKPSIMEADLGTLSTTSGSIKRSAGRVIRIINNLDHTIQVGSHPFTKLLSNKYEDKIPSTSVKLVQDRIFNAILVLEIWQCK